MNQLTERLTALKIQIERSNRKSALHELEMVLKTLRQPLHVVVILDGGLVQDVLADRPANYTVVDLDVEGSELDEREDVPEHLLNPEIKPTDDNGMDPVEACVHSHPCLVHPVATKHFS
jgi:hypothetical protein